MEFKSWRSYWDFQWAVKTQRRYQYTGEVREFLETVLETGLKRKDVIEKDWILWRSQLGCESEEEKHGEGESQESITVPVAFSPARMVPQRSSANEGRANPKGIPCLYLSDDEETALAEVRPWVGSLISLAQFKITRTLNVVDFSRDQRQGHIIYMREPAPAERELAVWRDINTAFSTPVSPSESEADYAPTQIITELFKANGFDGIIYRSSCGAGHNVALFDIESARLLNATVYSANSVKFEFGEITNRYFMQGES